MALQSLDNTSWKFNSEITTTVKSTLPEGSSFKVKINGIIYDGYGISCKYYSQIYMGLKKGDTSMNFAYVKTTDMIYKGYGLSSGEGWYDVGSEGYPKIEGDVYLYIDTAVLGNGGQENLDNFIAQLEANATQIIENKKYLKINNNIIGFVNNKKISSVDNKPIQSGKFSFKDKIILTNQKSIAVTTNFSDFTLFSNITNSNILDVCYANGILAMIVNSNTNNFIYTRDEGKTWTYVTLPITYTCYSLMYANGFWSCCKYSSNSSDPSSTYTVTIAKSTDLTTWTTSSYTCDSNHTYVYSNGYFIRNDYIRSIHKPYLYYSTDLVTWTQQEVTTEY